MHTKFQLENLKGTTSIACELTASAWDAMASFYKHNDECSGYIKPIKENFITS
jgi:hypothetical protein